MEKFNLRFQNETDMNEMSTSGLIFLTLSFLGFVIILSFWQAIKQDRKLGDKRLSFLTRRMRRNGCQLKKRQGYLNRYKFSEYNLSEALIIQPEIELH